MKLASKFQLATLIAGLVALNVTSCAKKENIAPANSNNATAPVPVYDIKNTAAIYPTTGITVDASGNVYVADYADDIIKMITPNGVEKVIAGSGHIGSADGTGTAASFNYPESLAIDAANNLYVANSGNNMIRKISPAGVVTTIAGNGTVGSVNEMGPSASFNFPQGIAVDNAGNIYVDDTGNDLIRKIGTDGTVTTLAGKVTLGKTNGRGVQATFNIPQGMTVDGKGNLYVADAGNDIIREITPLGVVSTFAGSGFAKSADGTGIQASFNFPDAISIDGAGDLYVTDAGSNQVRKITTEAKVTALPFSKLAFGGQLSYGGAPAIDLPILPNGIASDKNGINIYVADYGNGWVELF